MAEMKANLNTTQARMRSLTFATVLLSAKFRMKATLETHITIGLTRIW